MEWSIKVHFAIAITLRLLLICYGRIHDLVFDVRFTDIDYYVFTDAAEYVFNGESPYNRSTYRYTPLIAWILTPGHAWDVFEFGKLLFTVFDLISAWLIYRLVRRGDRGNDDRMADISACMVLYNPFGAVVSARGNAESILSVVVLWTLDLLDDGNWIGAGLVHGLAVHLKIYPIIYLPSIFFKFASIPNGSVNMQRFVWSCVTNIRGFAYGLLCAGMLFAWTGLFYAIYGTEFVDESLLYHVSRRDVKHNFSPYFYPLYLTQDDPRWSWIGSTAFVPQSIPIVLISWRYRRDLAFNWFACTLAFVTFNKVCTSQYFVWYLTLVPLIWYKLDLERWRWLKLIAAWCASQALWLGLAYLLEFRGLNVFLYVWIASLLFFAVNCWILYSCIHAYDSNRRFRVKKAS